jgi:magnesium-transporting ATPase (P-type)
MERSNMSDTKSFQGKTGSSEMESTRSKRLQGLSETQATARMAQIDLEVLNKKEMRRFIWQALRKNFFTLFNFDLIGMAVMLYLLGSTLGALGSLLVLVLAVGINTFQEAFAKKELEKILEDIQPQATVIRDGRIRSIDRWNVVEGDLLVVRRGDQIMVNGEIVQENSLTVEEIFNQDQATQRVEKQVGDQLLEGSYCVSGHATYMASESGSIYIGAEAETKIKLFHEEPTPLQRVMRVVFLGLLGLVIFFSILLLIDAFLLDAQLVSDEYRDGFSIIFAVGPTSLFLVLIVQYAMGTLRFMDYGALIFESNKIEALSNVSAVCFSEESLYSQLQVRFEPVPSLTDEHQLSETLIQRLLGDILYSTPTYSPRASRLAESLPGESFQPLETVPLLRSIGWYGVSFDETDLRGTFIIGKPEAIESALRKEKKTISQQVDRSVSKASQGLQRWLNKVTHKDIDETQEVDPEEMLVTAITESETDPEKKSVWRQRVLPKVMDLLESIEEKDDILEIDAWQGEETFLFAYLPDPVSLFDQNNQPELPTALLPLSYIHISDAIRPEISQVLQDLAKDGNDVKVLSTASPERAIATAHKLGLEEDAIRSTNGIELKESTPEAYAQAVKGSNVFGNLTPAQKANIITTLRQQGEYVTMVGNDVSDIPAMRQAQISVSLRSGDPAAMKFSDMVLFKDSLQILPRLLFLGQRMVNGAVGMFKLYLSQVGAQLLILIYMLLFNFEQFPYHPTQGGVINAFAIVIPNILLPVWAAGGRLGTEEIRKRMIHFIIPSAILLSILGAVVYNLYLILDFGSSYPPAELVKQLKISDPQVFFAQQAVVYAFLFAGWLRVFFLQPPSQIWVGGAALRGDRRVIGLVIFSILAYVLVLIFPWLPLQEWLRITWLPSIRDYLILAGFAVVWAIILRTIWRLRLKRLGIDYDAEKRWYMTEKE